MDQGDELVEPGLSDKEEQVAVIDELGSRGVKPYPADVYHRFRQGGQGHLPVALPGGREPVWLFRRNRVQPEQAGVRRAAGNSLAAD